MTGKMIGKTMYYYNAKYPQYGIKEFIISDAGYVYMESNPLDADLMSVEAYYDIDMDKSDNYEFHYALTDTDVEDLYSCEMFMSSYRMSTDKDLIEEYWKYALERTLKQAEETVGEINKISRGNENE